MIAHLGIALFVLIGTVGNSSQLRGIVWEGIKHTEVIVGIEELTNIYVLPELKGLFSERSVMEDSTNLLLARSTLGRTGVQWEDQNINGNARKLHYFELAPKKLPVLTGWTNPNTEAGNANGR